MCKMYNVNKRDEFKKDIMKYQIVDFQIKFVIYFYILHKNYEEKTLSDKRS